MTVPMKRLSRTAARNWAIGTIAGVVVADQVTKHLTVTGIDRGERVNIGLGVDLVHTLNSGVAFSRGQGQPAIIIPILLVVIVVSTLAAKELRNQDGAMVPAVIGYSLILGGAFGNLADRLFRGRGWGRGSVIDMVDVGWWPVFNLADSALSIGVVLVIVGSLLHDRSVRSAKTLEEHINSNEAPESST